MTEQPGTGRAPKLTGVTGGFAMALAMWCAWFAANAIALGLHRETAGRGAVIAAALGAGLVTAMIYGRRLAGRASWTIGLGAGLVGGVLGLVAIGSLLGDQPESTSEMADAANRVGGSGVALAAGVLAGSAITGVVGMLVGGRLAREGATTPPTGNRVLGWLGVITALSILPVLVLGGLVTGTESGLAVPDGVTSYGAFSILFPNSLMTEPRIFLEHSHRLAGSLAGLNAIGLLLAACVVAPPKRWVALAVTAAVFSVGIVGIVLTKSPTVSPTVGMALLMVLGIGTLGFAHAGIGRGVATFAAAGTLCLVAIQGALGIVRVDEQSTGVAMMHGVFAQIVFATGAMAAALLVFRAMPPATVAADARAGLAGARKLALGAVIVTTMQIALGALVRHADGDAGSMHAIITHALFSLMVVVVVVVLAFKCQKRAAENPGAAALRPIGTGLLVVVAVQFALGWVAFWATQTGGDPRPVPTAGELAEAHPIDLTEALITTAHQTGGALLLAGAALALFWTRRLARAAA